MTPPGWFPAPDNSGRQQWWDGVQWTAHFAPSTQPQFAPSALQEQLAAAYVPRTAKQRGVRIAVSAIIAVIVIGALVVTGILLLG